MKVSAIDPASELARNSARQALLLAGLAMICLLVAGGSYLIGCATARELEVAKTADAGGYQLRWMATLRRMSELRSPG